VTGGAGFIGSHLVDALIDRGHQVRVLDDLSTGLSGNLPDGVELIEADLCDGEAAARACEDVEVVFHQGALGSVRRSVVDPLETNRVNVHGTLTILTAARQAGARRVVSASSSSVYGGEAPLPTSEAHPVAPKSPYAVSKLAAEHYSRVHAALYGLETVVLRYFNVYGPRQRPDSPYAAVIPLFIDAVGKGEPPTIEGDGHQTRDFTFVGDAVNANLLAATAPPERCSGRVFNVAGGRRCTILDVLSAIQADLGSDAPPRFTDARAGDVRDSLADLTAITEALDYRPATSLESGLKATIEALRPERGD